MFLTKLWSTVFHRYWFDYRLRCINFAVELIDYQKLISNHDGKSKKIVKSSLVIADFYVSGENKIYLLEINKEFHCILYNRANSFQTIYSNEQLVLIKCNSL